MTISPSKNIENQTMIARKTAPWTRWIILMFLVVGVLSIFITRTILAHQGSPPRLFAVFNVLTILLSLAVAITGFRFLRKTDLLLVIIPCVLLGVQVTFTGFYPLIELPGRAWTSLAHGAGLAAALLAGLVVMRQGGPVRLRLALGEWKKVFSGVLFGGSIGLPFAILNVLAFSLLQGQPVHWQNPVSAALDALQPAIVEEVVYRFAFLGLVWLLFRERWPRRAVLIACLVSLLVHSYAHLDDLFRDNPIFALAYGAVLGLIWGLPLVLLAVRRDLESAVGFHWIQDFLRFAAGF